MHVLLRLILSLLLLQVLLSLFAYTLIKQNTLSLPDLITKLHSFMPSFSQLWRNWSRGPETKLSPQQSESRIEVWIYLVLSAVKCLWNIGTIQKKFSKRLDNIQVIQFLLVSALSCYLFFLDLWLSINRDFKTFFSILPVLSFLSMELDFIILARWLGFEIAYVFQIFCAVVSISIFLINKGSYWLFIPYILIPSFDFIKIFKTKMQAKCDSFMYIEHLLPSFFILAFIKPLDKACQLLYHPETEVIDTCGVFLAFGLLLIVLKKFVRHLYLHKNGLQYQLSSEHFSHEESCSICLEKLKEKIAAKEVKEENKEDDRPQAKQGNWLRGLLSPQSKTQGKMVLMTPCKHLFHKMCLENWLQTKPGCPYCRHDLSQFL